MRQENFPGAIRTSRVALSALAGLMKKAEIEKSGILAVGSALGPGSFTGLRIGLVTAKGLAFGLERPLYGISSMDALADSALRRNQEKNPAPPNWILTYRDAYHGEIFTALFGPCSLEGGSAPTCPRAGEDRVSLPEEVQLPETGTVLLAGGEEDLPPAWSGGSLGSRFQLLDIPSAPDGVSRLTWEAMRRGDLPAGPEIQPVYGRKPRAETQWSPPGT